VEAVIVAVLIAARPHFLADYTFTLGAVLLIVSFWNWAPTRPPAPALEETPLLRLKSSDLASGVIVARPREYVTLSVDTGDAEPKRQYTNLRVNGVFDADGRNVGYTGEMVDFVLLAVDKINYDEIIASMKEKDASISLWPQAEPYTPTPMSSSASPTVTPMPVPTATPMPKTAAFTLAPAKVQADLDLLNRGDRVLAILVVERKDSAGTVVGHESGRYQATLLDVLDARGSALSSPYRRATQIRLGLSRESDEAMVEQFARQLAGASAIYLFKSE
jgi:hypothetical protein